MIYSDVDYGSGDKGLVRHSGSRGERKNQASVVIKNMVAWHGAEISNFSIFQLIKDLFQTNQGERQTETLGKFKLRFK